MQIAITKYLDYLGNNAKGSEIEYRTPFENFFNEFAKDTIKSKKITIIQEPKRKPTKTTDRPDFFVYENYDSPSEEFIGLIECKKPNTNLDKIKESEQIKNYVKTTDNIILTNYQRFILLQKDKPERDIVLKRDDPHSIQSFENLFCDFCQYDYPYIDNKKTLVKELADQSVYYSVALREFIKDEENKDEKFYEKFNKLFKEYPESLSYSYTIEDFCDIYSQSLVYGLLLARLNTDKKLDEVRLNYLEDIPSEYNLLYDFLDYAYDYRELPSIFKPVLINIGKKINRINIPAIKNEFAKPFDLIATPLKCDGASPSQLNKQACSANNEKGKEHIAIYLYEDFLQAYDKKRRKESGVYYTPVEATNFITRAVNDIIKTKFKLPNGYLADKIKILDFACGTGTFLRSVFEQMLEPFEKEGNKLDAVKKDTIRNKIANDIYGFELLFVPYIIAHTILTSFLQENGIILREKERLGVYLTNTLDIEDSPRNMELFNLEKEYDKARNIKKNDILAIIGNPPYFNGKSQAKTDELDKKLKEYKKDLKERKINLDDLYIKFIRFAEWKIEEQEKGIIGIITNNGYLDGITFRQMRKHLYEAFDEIYILNLHGNTRKKETDKNIFDIMVGVAIVLFVKLQKKATTKTVKYFSTLDNKFITRSDKLDFLENTKFKNVKWKTLKPVEPNYWFVDKKFYSKNEYSKFWKIVNLFEHYNSGIQTKNDAITIHYNKQNLDRVITNFINLSEQNIATKYELEDTRDWKISTAKNDLIVNKDKNLYSEILYRPFDKRITYFTGKTKGFIAYPRYDTMKHLVKENIGLCFTRNIDKDNFLDVFITDKPIDIHVVSGQNYLAPLYLYQEGNAFESADKTPNFTTDFSAFLKTLDFRPKPEKILAYIYAILHSPIYRRKYIEFLKTDFPAIPLTKDKTIFERYAKRGQKLIDLHLLKEKEVPKDNTIKLPKEVDFPFIIDNITHTDNKLLLKTSENKIVSIEGITQEIYDFEIGSYKPIDKWLKYRKKDSVPFNSKDLEHIKDMAVAIKNTIAIMQELESLGEEYLI